MMATVLISWAAMLLPTWWLFHRPRWPRGVRHVISPSLYVVILGVTLFHPRYRKGAIKASE